MRGKRKVFSFLSVGGFKFRTHEFFDSGLRINDVFPCTVRILSWSDFFQKIVFVIC